MNPFYCNFWLFHPLKAGFIPDRYVEKSVVSASKGGGAPGAFSAGIPQSWINRI